ncbi:MAG: GldG family protein [Melioribacteraceae bacterium]|nr:GldG family protein [Melioribacteraceae bacterium]MCF8263832.1 GldG family protein [Melioribacteraceae bacterium]MCF8412513.1 GldG family protein [Melioribacteraceae bacterium]MCF8432178.1 GldG family protein [Melioribacteraceae bacterium]
MLTRRKLQISVAVVFGILLLVNLIGDKLYLRLDFTADQRYSLSDATINILSNLDDAVTVTAYFSEDLPPDIARVRQEFRDLLTEYASRSGGLVVYEFINPNENQQEEMNAQQNGIRPVMINVREKDQVKQQKAYLGAVIKLADRTEVIPVVQPGTAMEYELSTSIKKIAVVNKPKVAILQGHGQPKLSEMQQLVQSLEILYQVDTLNLVTEAEIPFEYRTVAMIAPKDSISEINLAKLDKFLSTGGRLLLAINAVSADLQTGQGSKLSTGVSEWLSKRGIQIEEKFLIDLNCSNVMVEQQQGMFRMRTPVKFPYIPIINTFADHPITSGLEAVVFPFASPISFVPKDTSIFMTSLAQTSEKAGIKEAPLFFDVSKNWTQTDFDSRDITIGAAFEGRLVGDNESKMVLFGDGDFVVNGEGREAQQLSADNISMMVNAIDWLSDDTGLIELRTKGITSRPIDPNLEEGTKTLLKYLNFLLPIILIIIYGIFRFQVRRNLRNKLANIDYAE